ncbi:hypothetical protein V493_03814 [Pseudogymnoascus sp. VKM F-4281 (FW-2241)]|nr:hypothetical protein V493_03814 [Pseudogymnoascus sp. VKM F-4281 (FW-2241)]
MSTFRSSAPEMNDRERGFLADFMVGGKQQKRRPSATIQRCAFGEGCRKLVTSKNMGNVPMPKPSDFCDIPQAVLCNPWLPTVPNVIQYLPSPDFECTITGCSQQRVGSPNGGWWDCCAHHQCDANGCYAPRKYNVLKGRHFTYCPKHKCVREGCERSHPLWQLHCTTHTCVKSGCGVIVEGDEKLCARPTEYTKTETTSYSAHVTRHAGALSAQKRKNPAQSSAACMNAENRVAISVAVIKPMGIAERITARSQVATTSK